MAVDNVSTEYHLTPEGWVTGTHRNFGKIDGNDIERPRSAVETWEFHIYQRSMYSEERHTWRMRWHDASVPEAEREALHASFKRPL